MFRKSIKDLIRKKWRAIEYRFNNSKFGLFVLAVSYFCSFIYYFVTIMLVSSISFVIGERRGAQ